MFAGRGEGEAKEGRINLRAFKSLRTKIGGQQDDSKTRIIAKDSSCIELLVR